MTVLISNVTNEQPTIREQYTDAYRMWRRLKDSNLTLQHMMEFLEQFGIDREITQKAELSFAASQIDLDHGWLNFERYLGFVFQRNVRRYMDMGRGDWSLYFYLDDFTLDEFPGNAV